MGLGNYHDDVPTAREHVSRQRAVDRDAFDYSRRASRGEAKGVHPEMNILGKFRECRDSDEHPETTPIFFGMDVTSSRGDDAIAIYQQVPSMNASLKLSDIVSHPSICFAAFGDANSDVAPIQIGQFEADQRMDEDLKRIFMEKGGGGTGEESAELLAYFLARKTELDAWARGEKGFAFITTDEAPYAKVSKEQVQRIIGDSLRSNITSKKIFKELMEKYHTFVIFPRSSMEDRKESIDNEIKQRLDAAGGRYKDVDIRASLIWHTYDDLDLHCVTPSGEHISYRRKNSHCGGELDVDRNAGGRETRKPVENIRWAKGDALKGRYRFWVRNYAYHDDTRGAIPFTVELDVQGKIETFRGEIPAGAVSRGDDGYVAKADYDQLAFEFAYTPGEREREREDAHEAYHEDVILEKWADVLPRERVLRVQDAASSVEVALGAMALQAGTMDLDRFEQDMIDRQVAEDRRSDVLTALADFARVGVVKSVDENLFD